MKTKPLSFILIVILTILIRFSVFSQPNVACKFDNYQVEVLSNAVCKISVTKANGDNSTCSGILINNEGQDRKPYVLTARHCITNSGLDVNLTDSEKTAVENSAQFTFRLRKKDCEGIIDEQTVTYQKAIFRAAHFYTDFALLEIAPENLPLAPDLNYAGRSRLSESSGSLTSIAHPNGDPQKYGRGHKATAQSLDPWKYTITWDEGNGIADNGASGGPLFSEYGRVIGMLSNGNPGGQGDYGKVSTAWNSNSDNAKQLKHWLSPNQDLGNMGTLIPMEQGPVSNICNNNTRTSTLPNLGPGQSVTWSVTPGLSIVSSTSNSVTVTSTSGQYGVGQIKATYGPTTRTKDVYYGTPDVSNIKYDNGLNASNYNYVTPNTYHNIKLDVQKLTMANVTGYVDWHPSSSYGYSTGQYFSEYLVSLPAGQVIQFNPISVTNSCGTSNRSMVFAAYSGFSIYPNPVSDVLSVRFDNTEYLETLPEEINLYNEKSTIPIKTFNIKQVYNSKLFKDNNLAIDVKDLPRGHYFLHITPNKLDKKNIDKIRVVLK
ncbi:trypsin-like peptidase domain-containing protein [Dyadobacter sp. 3J3]|uniref:trypsin-like peptidase domain-containing protein n=1 Tax=Dyadobacter sp. 3J3 TaxID=2606600 RepID=UPI00135B436F|nr:trypsin-like peptidase domain-containing protein [Dyadobacter sp. 3J3]